MIRPSDPLTLARTTLEGACELIERNLDAILGMAYRVPEVVQVYDNGAHEDGGRN